MASLGHLSGAELQNLMVLPWELSEKLLAIVPLLWWWRSHSYPSPQFKVGDFVAEDWVDEFDNNATDFGEVRGLCYLPVNYFGYPANTWVYFIYWKHTTCGKSSAYPYFGGEPILGHRLKLVKQS
jgi:hypothetical protein